MTGLKPDLKTYLGTGLFCDIAYSIRWDALSQRYRVIVLLLRQAVNKREPFFLRIILLLILLLLAFWLDDPIRGFIKQHTSSQSRRVMAWITRLGEGTWLLILSFAIWLGGYLFKRRWMQAGRFSCYAFVLSSLVGHLKTFRWPPASPDIGPWNRSPGAVLYEQL